MPESSSTFILCAKSMILLPGCIGLTEPMLMAYVLIAKMLVTGTNLLSIFGVFFAQLLGISSDLYCSG